MSPRPAPAEPPSCRSWLERNSDRVCGGLLAAREMRGPAHTLRALCARVWWACELCAWFAVQCPIIPVAYATVGGGAVGLSGVRGALHSGGVATQSYVWSGESWPRARGALSLSLSLSLVDVVCGGGSRFSPILVSRRAGARPGARGIGGAGGARPRPRAARIDRAVR